MINPLLYFYPRKGMNNMHKINISLEYGFLLACRAFLRDVDLNMSDYDGRTPLHLCSAEGHIDCVKFLLEVCKVYPDPKDRSSTNFDFAIFLLICLPST